MTATTQALPLALLTATAFMTLAPQPSFLFNAITLPVLVYLESNTNSLKTSVSFIPQVLSLAVGNAVRSLFTLLQFLGPLEAGTAQLLASSALATAIAAVPATHAALCRRLPTQPLWARAWGFGVLWAATWRAWEAISPLGRYGIPSAVIDMPVATLLLHLAGPVGLDILLGAFSYTVFLVASSLLEPPTDAALIQLHSLDGVSDASDTCGDDHDGGGRLRLVSPRSTAAAATIIAVALLTLPSIPDPLSLAASVDTVTPVTVGCVLPRKVREYLPESQKMGSLARIVVWPETAVYADDAAGRDIVLKDVHTVMGKQYGSFVVVGIDSPPAGNSANASSTLRTNEAVLVGPDGIQGTYTKQHLFPITESFSSEWGSEPPPHWIVPLPPPAGVTRPDWSDAPGSVSTRGLGVSPLICLDAFHPSALSVSPPPDSDGAEAPPPPPPAASLLIIPAAFPSSAEGLLALTHVRTLAVTHHVTAFVCSASKYASPADSGFAAVVDPWGRITHLQVGASLVAALAIPRTQPLRSLWQVLGPAGVLALALHPLAGVVPWSEFVERIVELGYSGYSGYADDSGALDDSDEGAIGTVGDRLRSLVERVREGLAARGWIQPALGLPEEQAEFVQEYQPAYQNDLMSDY